MLKTYWDANQKNPYPSDAQKASLCKKSGLTKTQVDNWLINMRKRQSLTMAAIVRQPDHKFAI